MRLPILIALLVGCGNDVGMEPDGLGDPETVDPRVIAGGGIGDGPIDGVVNLYVIDDATRQPVANATVRVGEVNGTTDATGLFVARGVTGPQTITVIKSGYRADMWIGVNGANVTIDVEPANAATPPKATLTASITNIASLPVAAGHIRLALASYSQTDDFGDDANNIETPGGAVCIESGGTCSFSIVTRTGKVGLIAAIFDRDTKGTPTPDDDTQVLLGWAAKTGLVVTANTPQAVALDLVPAAQQQTITVNFGSTPSGLTNIAGLVGIETADGMLPLVPMFTTPAAATFRAPRPDAIASGATYRLTGFANNGGTTSLAQSVVLRRGLTGTALSAGAWVAPPAGTPSRTGGSFTPSAGATVHTLEYKQGATNALSISIFDGTTSVTIPDMVAMPTGSLDASITAIGAPGLDTSNFSLDADRAKLTMVGGQSVQLQ
jgi:hypothetical protein